MSSIIDSSGVINAGLVAHVQSMSVNKVVQANSSAQELSQAALEDIATDNVQKESGQVGKTTSTQFISHLHDEEKQQNNQTQQQATKQEKSEPEQNESISAQSSSPFVGNLLNIKI